MTYFADARIEVEFIPGTWTDISDYLEGEVTISFGRQDELSQADANQCSFALDNTDGRFTPGKVSSPYYPDVKVGLPVRVTAVMELVESRRFTGFVDSWQVVWDGADTAARVEVSASSLLARLGLTNTRRSVIEEECALAGPVAHYTMGEESGATQASDSSGAGAAPLSRLFLGGPAPVFGDATGPPTDGLTGVTFAAGGDAFETILPASPSGDWTVEFFFSSTDTTEAALIGLGDLALVMNSVSDANGLEIKTTSIDSVSTTHVDDGAVHHIALRWEAATATASLLVDGAVVRTVTDSSTPAVNGRLRVGNFLTRSTGFGPYPSQTWTPSGSFAHVVLYHSVVPASTLAAHASLGSVGLAGDTITTRLARYASWVGVTSTSSTTTRTVAHVDTSGAGVVDLMRQLEDTEDGVLHDSRSGEIVLTSRADRYTATVAAEFSVAAQQVGNGYAPTTDRQGLANDVTVSAADGTGSARSYDQGSMDAYGVATYSVETITQDVADLRDRAAWILHTRSTPRERVPTLVVDVVNCGVEPAVTLGLGVGSRVRVSDLPAQAAQSVVDYFVEGGSETLGAALYQITFNVSPAEPWTDTLVLDDPARGALDSHPLAL